jgi:steroid delta-isomerase-like uncharacterized protein
MSATDVLNKWVDALNRHDAAAIAALLAPDVIVHDPAYAEPLEGREAARKDAEAFLRAFPDLRVTVQTIIESDRGYAIEGTFTGTHQGPLVTGSSEIPATGKRMTLRAASFGRLDGQGRVLEERRYYDVAGLLGQLGLAT